MEEGQGFMALEEYVRKRTFENTPEPPAKSKAGKPAAGGAHFYVQRHDATRLHYDFRLEIGGVLVSWAVPKGPSLEPLSKHLAAKVEDHPFDYGEFEGNIPAGNYGAGSVMLWDCGTWELLGDAPVEEQLARGDLKFRLNGEKLKGEFALILMKGRGKGNEWLMIKSATTKPWRDGTSSSTPGAYFPGARSRRSRRACRPARQEEDRGRSAARMEEPSRAPCVQGCGQSGDRRRNRPRHQNSSVR
jgi:DNA ligase D-like protein (predicted 3'-phosphoesterase)